MIAKIDEQQMPMVALAVDPSGQADRFADIALAKRGTVMGSIGVHDQVGPLAADVRENRGPRFTGAKLFVNPRGRR
jgi:hypothetical protein